MCDAVRHRGQGGVQLDSGSASTLGYLGWRREQNGDGSAGLFTEADAAIALAGFVWSKSASLPRMLRDYRKHGPKFLQGLSGAFVMAIRDGQRLFLARDGAGARSIYYARHEGRLLFSIEPKGMWLLPGFPRRLRPSALLQYLTFSFVPGRHTMLEDVFELPPGAYLEFDGKGAPAVTRYFQFEGARPEGRAEKDWIDEFRTQLGGAIRRRLPNNEPVAVFLSGGLDSSVVAAEAVRQYDGPLKSYTIHFGQDYPNELDHARSVARHLKLDHEEVLIQPKDFLPKLREAIWHLDDPIGDPITTPNFQLAAHVSREARWSLNGEGGDPCFGGPKNIPMLLQHWYGGVDRADDFREQAYLQSYRRCYDDLRRLLSPDFLRQVDFEDDLQRPLRPFFRQQASPLFLDKLAAINIRLKGGQLILPKIERMLGASGMIPLAPLFDERLIRLSFEMPSHLRLHHGVEKVVMKRAYAGDLPSPVINRPKSGMRVPVHFWFQHELKRYARKVLNPRRIRQAGIFDPQRVKQLLAYDIEEGPGRYGIRIWMLLTFEIWRRLVIEGETV